MADDKNLKEREYRDEKGEVHHHTHEYMERKGDEGEGSKGERGSTEERGSEDEERER